MPDWGDSGPKSRVRRRDVIDARDAYNRLWASGVTDIDATPEARAAAQKFLDSLFGLGEPIKPYRLKRSPTIADTIPGELGALWNSLRQRYPAITDEVNNVSDTNTSWTPDAFWTKGNALGSFNFEHRTMLVDPIASAHSNIGISEVLAHELAHSVGAGHDDPLSNDVSAEDAARAANTLKKSIRLRRPE